MFHVRWAKVVVREDKYFTTMSIPDEKSATVNINTIAKTEPWVHAKHVTQCFFIADPANPSRVVVRRSKRSIVGMDGVANEEDYDQDPMSEDDADDDETYVKRRSKNTLPKKNRIAWKRRSHHQGLNYSTANKK